MCPAQQDQHVLPVQQPIIMIQPLQLQIHFAKLAESHNVHPAQEEHVLNVHHHIHYQETVVF